MPRINWIEAVPRKFFSAYEKTPKARTVGELIALLQELPPSLRVESEFGKGVQVEVYNITIASRHVRITEPE